MRPSEPHDTITPQRVVKILWRRKVVCLIVAAVVFLGGAAYLLTRPRIYESSSSVALLPVSSNAAILPNYPNLIASLIPTYVQLVSSSALLDQVAETLPFRVSASQLANEVFAESLSNAAVINIVGESTDPVRAQQIAAATTSVFLAQVRGNGVVVARIYSRPTVPDQPSSPKTKLLLSVILIMAVALGLAAGLTWDRLSGHAEEGDQPAPPAAEPAPEPAARPATEPAAIPAAAPPVLGVVRHSGPDQAIGWLRDGPAADDQESWRSLRANFMYALLGKDIRTVTVLSPAVAESATAAGSAAVAVRLAAAAAGLGLAVILVDANLRDPRLHRVVNLDNDRGLTSTVLDGAEPAALTRPVPGVTGLQAITAGRPLPAGSDQDVLLREQLPRIAALADLVVADGPPLGEGTGGGGFATATGGVVLVLPADTVTTDQAGRAIRDLRAAGARVLGTVLTGIGDDRDGSGSYRSAGTATASPGP